jgi:hypothetical protein
LTDGRLGRGGWHRRQTGPKHDGQNRPDACQGRDGAKSLPEPTLWRPVTRVTSPTPHTSSRAGSGSAHQSTRSGLRTGPPPSGGEHTRHAETLPVLASSSCHAICHGNSASRWPMRLPKATRRDCP